MIGLARLRVGRVVVACLVLAGAAAISAPARSGAVDAVPSHVLVVSGSSLAGIRWYSTESAMRGADFTFDLESCRRTNGQSCKGREGRIPSTVLDVVKTKGAGKDVLIVFAGYNEGTTSLSKGFDLVVKAARAKGIKKIIWTTLRTNVDYISPRIASFNDTFLRSNAMLHKKIDSGRYPDVVLADWDTYSTRETSWFVTDGVHFTIAGAWGAADYLSRKLAWVEGRACPTPRRAGEEPQNPCPDPDAAPPDVDLVSLYPIDPAALHCYEVGADLHIECRPDYLVAAITDTLRYGMNGNEVRALQLRLAARGYLGKSHVTKVYDRYTFEAVIAYQQRRGLPVSGVAGPATRAALGFGCPELDALGTNCPPDNEPLRLIVPLKFGNSGVQVKLLQQRLKDLGLFTSKPDGRFGPKTRAAVRSFQKANGITSTGVVDAPTAVALGLG